LFEVKNERPFAERELNRRYLTFTLMNDEYGVELARVLEIRGFVPASAIPFSPSYLVGILNLKGAIVPLIDLRHKLGLPMVARNEFNTILLTRIRDQIVGIVVDQLSGVANIPIAGIEPIADATDTRNTEMLIGAGIYDGHRVALLDLDEVVTERFGAVLTG